MNQSLKVERRNDIDWLRIFAVLLLVPFHSALIFVLDPNSIMYIKDSINSEFLYRAEGIVHQFHMPLLFALAGISTYFALNFRSAKQYMNERFKRLLVPAIFGIIVLIPPMTYITGIARGDSESFISHFIGFFSINPADLAGYYGTLTPAHLWFIVFLFIFSAAGLPIFISIHKRRSQGFVKGLANFFSKPLALSLPGILIALAASLDILGDKNPVVYFLIFFFGFLIMTDESYQKAINRDAPFIFVISIIFEIIQQTIHINSPAWSLPWLLFGLMENLNRWLWVISILGLGHRFIKSGGPALKYLSEAAFPFYILHLPINTLVGYFIIKLPMGVAPKYISIVILTIALDFMVYEILKRMNLFRFLLGMKLLSQNPRKISIPLDKNTL